MFIQQQHLLQNLPTLMSNAMMNGYQQGVQNVRAEIEGQKLVDRIMLQDQLQRSEQLEAEKRQSYNRKVEHGFRDITGTLSSEWASMGNRLPKPEGSVTDAYGQTFMPPSAPELTPEQQEDFTVIKGTAPGDYNVVQKPTPGLKIGSTREVKQGDQIITQELTKKGWVNIGQGPRWDTKSEGIVVYDPNTGKPIVQTGVSGNAQVGGMTKTTITNIEKELMDANKAFSRIKNVQAQFKPEFQEIKTKIGSAWTAAKEKMGVKPTKQEAEALVKFSQHKRRSISNLNQYIKEITGAALSREEAERIMRGMPNPGTGLFDGDSATEYEAKMNDVMSELQMAIGRLNYVKRNGMTSIEDIPLQNMPDIINRRGSQIEQDMKKQNPNIDDKTLKAEVLRSLAGEFGLEF